MKTVGEFKKAGLKFVNGDKGDGFCVKAHKYFGMSSVFDNKRATSFAWRENTGVKPEFNGFIDFTHKDGTEYFSQKVGSIHCYEWGIVGSANQIAKWRPSLNQPSVAESDTKQSAIHKAWVDLKGDLSNANKYDSKPHYLIFCIKDTVISKSGKYLLTECVTNNDEYWRNVCTIQEFTDYCEKMAAEEKRMDIIGQNGNEGLHYDNTAQQVEALAVNDKPTFTQAMADENELKERFDLIIPYNKCINQIAEYLKVTTSGVDVLGDNNKWCATAEDIIKGIEKLVNYDSHPDIEWMPMRDSECLFSYGGSEFKSCKYIGKSTVGTKSYAVLFVHEKGEYENFKFCSDLKFKPIDTRTDKQKDIDAAMTDIDAERGDRASVAGVVERMIAAGYRKC